MRPTPTAPASAPELLTPHFSLAEMCVSQQAVRMGIDNTPAVAHVVNLRRVAIALEWARAVLGNRPITVTSAYRCLQLNRSIGSADSSAHVRGLAVDFVCPAFGRPTQICRRLVDEGMSFDQLIDEQGWVHLGLAEEGAPRRQQVLTAVFKPGAPTLYRPGLAH